MRFYKGMTPWNKGSKGRYNNKPFEYKKAWLSGFLDGEGSFIASYTKNNDFCIALSINLRADDDNTLKLVYELFNNSGSLKYYRTNDKVKRNPIVTWKIASITDLFEKVIPILDEYPLLSKKRRDYEIWKIIVSKLYKTKHKQISRNKIKEELLKLINNLHKVKLYQERRNNE